MSERAPGTVVERTETGVMFLRTAMRPAQMQSAWERLESTVGTSGRKFYATFDPATEDYRVCVELKDGDDPAALGLERGAIAGGRYLRSRLRGEPPEVYGRIGPTFAALAEAARPDPTRPSIEFYRSRNQIDLLLPALD